MRIRPLAVLALLYAFLPSAVSAASSFDPLSEKEWGEFVQETMNLTACVEMSRPRRPPQVTVATLLHLGLADEIKSRSLALLPSTSDGYRKVNDAMSDVDAITYSFHEISKHKPDRLMDQARTVAFLYYYEAKATEDECTPSPTFLRYYTNTLK